ncbi:protein phosphatase 2C [Pelomyxa schiedti]|nr:protein phosphatase 2C [Pelomyxa schiedti]
MSTTTTSTSTTASASTTSTSAAKSLDVAILGPSRSGKSTLVRAIQLCNSGSTAPSKEHVQLVLRTAQDTVVGLARMSHHRYGKFTSPEAQAAYEAVTQLGPGASANSRDLICILEDKNVKALLSRHPEIIENNKVVQHYVALVATMPPNFTPSKMDILYAYDQKEQPEPYNHTNSGVSVNFHTLAANHFTGYSASRVYNAAILTIPLEDFLSVHVTEPEPCWFPAVAANQSVSLRSNKHHHSGSKHKHHHDDESPPPTPPTSAAAPPTTAPIPLCLKAFESLCQHEHFRKTTLVFLILSHMDLFSGLMSPEKVHASLPDYTGPIEVKDVLNFISRKFQEIKDRLAAPFKIQIVTESLIDMQEASLSSLLQTIVQLAQPPPSSSPTPVTPTVKVSTSASPSQSTALSPKPTGPVPQPPTQVQTPPPPRPVINETKKLTAKGYVFAQIGRRPTMEDEHVLNDTVKGKWKDKVGYYAIFDGHAGKQCAEIAAKMLHTHLFKNPLFLKGNIEDSIKAAYAATEEACIKDGGKSGCTAVTCVLSGRTLFVANLGDSECVLGRKEGPGSYRAELLSKKHSPSDPIETARIKAAGGAVLNGRIFGLIAVARSLGDKEYKEEGHAFISSLPHIMQRPLCRDDTFMLMACDGLWDKWSYQDAINFVGAGLDAKKPPAEIAKTINDQAIERGSDDNVSVLLVIFNWT